jgi:ABC-type antimicrobial peptide transport system permease subunit
VKDSAQRDWGAVAGNEFYFPQLQNPDNIQRYLTLVVRTAGNPLALAGTIESAVLSLDRDAPVSEIASMKQVVDRALWQPRFSMTLLTGFAALALVLAAIGVYGVMSQDVSSRTREIGIRMALGARPPAVLLPILGSAAKLALIGLVLGIGGAVALTRYLKTLLFEISPTDPLTLTVAAAVFGIVSLAAAWFPAHRATRVDPVTALRGE